MKTLIRLVSGGAMLGLLFAGSASAQAVDEILEEVQNNQCAEALRGCKDAGVGDAWKDARQACSALRKCKKECRQDKRAEKKEIRADKRDCVKACKDKKGKAKRDCKKECRQEAREEKKEARGAKRDCTRACRAEFKTPDCKKARMGLVKALGQCAKSAGPACFNELKDRIGK